MTQTLKTVLADYKDKVDRELDRLLPPESEPPENLHKAMRYAALSPGKRLRPILAMLGCEAAGGRAEQAVQAGCAFEMIHAYSLVHDDLPAMDDAALRRGRPTVHKTFGEAEAILAGDGLLTLAFEVMASAGPAETAAHLVRELAGAAGSVGMVGGQTFDLEMEGKPIDEAGLERIHRWKTGALIRTPLVVGGFIGRADEAQRQALSDYGWKAGLAFQVADDILDVEKTPEEIGKDTGGDAEAGKATYPGLLGLDHARRKARTLAQEAATIAQRLPNGDRLAELAWFFVERAK